MDDYGYVNARIRALRHDLLSREVLGELAGAPDLISARRRLEATAYGPGLLGVPSDAGIEALEAWLRREWTRSIQRLYGFTDGGTRADLELFLRRFEVENLKAVIRGVQAGVGQTEILASVLPTGIFDESALAELARQPSVRSIADLLFTWRLDWARPFRKTIGRDPDLRSLEPLEVALDRFYFESTILRLETLGDSAASLAPLVRLFIDRANLLTASKISSHGVLLGAEAVRYFIEGGETISRTEFEAIAQARDAEAFAGRVARTGFSEIAPRLGQESAVSSTVRLERLCDQVVLDRANRIGRSDPLGPGLMVAYLFSRHHEITNLRLVLRAKAYQMYADDVGLLFVS